MEYDIIKTMEEEIAHAQSVYECYLITVQEYTTKVATAALAALEKIEGGTL